MKIYFTQSHKHNLNTSVALGIAVLCVIPSQHTRVTNDMPH